MLFHHPKGLSHGMVVGVVGAQQVAVHQQGGDALQGDAGRVLQQFDAGSNADAQFARSQFAARLGDLDQAVQAVKRSLAAGYPWHIAAADANLGGLRDRAEFQALSPGRTGGDADGTEGR